MTRIAAALLLCLPAGTALAQAGGIAGKVTDRATQLPLAGVRVVVAGTALETQTNKDGEYRLTNMRPGRVHVGALRLGYKASYDSATVGTGQTATINFIMEQSLVTLSDVVVTGTAGNQERRAQSAQVATLPAAQVQQDATISTVGELLQSRVTGLAVNSASGSVGAARQIRIRGASSINLSNSPLIFIDGIRVADGVVDLAAGGQGSDRLNDLNPDDIESIEVVKGPAAATLYGADASAGVIQIMTKKGRPGTNRFSQTLRLEGGTIDQHWTPPDNYGNCSAALVAATSTNPLCRGKAVGTLVHDNPLVRTGAFRNGTDRTIGWSGRGGGQSYGYNLSVGADNAKGTLPDNGFERYNLRSNFDWVPTSQLTLDFGLGLIQATTFLPQNDNNIFGFLGGALLGSPLSRSDDGNPGQDGWFGFNRHVAAISAIEGSILTHHTTVTVSANYLPVAWFSNKFTVGGDESRDEQTKYFPKNTDTWYAGDLNLGNNVQTRRGLSRYTIDYLGNLRGVFGGESQWEGNLSFGVQAIVSRVDSISATGQGFVTNANNVIAAASTTTGSGGYTQQDQYGYLTQGQLGYRNRFFLQAGVRIDKFSSFGAKVPAFVLPKFGASWVISEERFFQPLTGIFGSFRLRGAWGTTGRTPGPGASLTTLAAAPYNLTGSNSAGAIPNNPGNPNLKAERGVEYEAGFDATVWRDRLSF
ncbi:MAG TPA: TonB-dependent receptor, partial [Gemmatimonadaceae bacterium]|nr:TonB-dependent receptor [Gemmatimonadaceae bacterium]